MHLLVTDPLVQQGPLSMRLGPPKTTNGFHNVMVNHLLMPLIATDRLEAAAAMVLIGKNDLAIPTVEISWQTVGSVETWDLRKVHNNRMGMKLGIMKLDSLI